MKFIPAVLFLALFIMNCTDRQEPASVDEPILQDTIVDSILIGQSDSFIRNTTSIGQLVYVPVYSHIYQQDQKRTFNLTTTLSVRNADPYRSFTLVEVNYYDSKGNLIQQYIDSGVVIDPLASTSYVIEERDLRGGVGASFLVKWESEESIIPPVLEAINISTSGQQGVSFLSVGRVLQERSTTETSR
ncbi:DUF3124 domain-containing protein [Rhodohalobacter sp. 8-1]|uniref:DUF3124 domain-containing protein n=1 Tax=Rhodohalobacter sp. 8-1 TaxID=3131972 RepID=UPI0030EC071C